MGDDKESEDCAGGLAPLHGRELVEVDVFAAGEARTYLTGRLPAALADDIDGVASDLGYLPLALAHAASFMIDADLICWLS